LRENGLYEPQSLEEWASVGLGQAELPWLSAKASTGLARSMSYFMLSNQLAKLCSRASSGASRQGMRLLQRPLHWRLKNHVFALPVELWVSMAQHWLTVRRSLLTGDPLGRQLKEVR
jgi:hypothetical protein